MKKILLVLVASFSFLSAQTHIVPEGFSGWKAGCAGSARHRPDEREHAKVPTAFGTCTGAASGTDRSCAKHIAGSTLIRLDLSSE